VTLVSGQVVVDNLMNHERVTMKPGQDVTLNKQQRFDVSAVDTEYYIQWKEGYFYFDNLPLVEVLKELGRWYNVDIRITDNSLMSYRLHFIADRSASIDQVVENLNGFSYLQVYKNGDGIVVSPKSVQRK
jgi:ferric-dicitrate binding protein FerR (iron transport regulator)